MRQFLCAVAAAASLLAGQAFAASVAIVPEVPLAETTAPKPASPLAIESKFSSMGIHSTTVLLLSIDKSGAVREAKIVKSDTAARDRLAVETAMTRWRFQPAVKNGAPVPSQVTVEVRW